MSDLQTPPEYPVAPPQPTPTPPPPPVAQQAQVEIATGLIVATGFFPAGPADPSKHKIVDMTTQQWANWQAAPPGHKHLQSDGTVTVTPPLPLPLRFETEEQVSATKRTTNDVPTEIYRRSCNMNRQFTAFLAFMAVNPVNWATKSAGMRYAFKRGTAGALFVGEYDVFNIDEQGSAAWDMQVAVEGNDFIVRVVGGRNYPVDWLVTGPIQIYVPAGF